MSILSSNIGHRYLLKPLKNHTSRRRLLCALLEDADKNVPFYKGRYAAFLKDSKGLNDADFLNAYNALPITTKDDLKSAHQDFMSVKFTNSVDVLSVGSAQSAAQLIEYINMLFIKRNFRIPLSTGGTSGTPAYRWLDADDANIMVQSFLESFDMNGWKRGEPFVLYYPLQSYFTDIYAAYNPWLHRLFGFTVVPFTQVTLESVKALLQTLQDKKASLLVIFPCVLQRVAEIMHTHNLPPLRGLRCINVSGEFFLDCSRDFVKMMFPDARIEMTYGAVEIGEIAHQHGDNAHDYKIFDQYAYVEQGPEDTLLITALRQRSFPMIRYKMEDKGRVVTKPHGQQFLMELEGKNTDFLVRSDGQRCYASYFDAFINRINPSCGNAIIHFLFRHDKAQARLAFVLKRELNNTNTQTIIEREALHMMRLNFPAFKSVAVTFPDHFDHNYTRKFKIIADGDGLSEVVGGYYKKTAS